MYSRKKVLETKEAIRAVGVGDKYEHAGIYCIKVNDVIMYIGKSVDMLERVAEHVCAIDDWRNQTCNKYKILAQLRQNGYKIEFDVMYDCPFVNAKDIEEDIGSEEGKFIRSYYPSLNYQIPREGNWRSWTANPRAKYITIGEAEIEIRRGQREKLDFF